MDRLGSVLATALFPVSSVSLTGILGNAELLLAEIRRHNAVQLSETGVKRLETVAALVVGMCETVRRLSQAYDSRVERVRSL